MKKQISSFIKKCFNAFNIYKSVYANDYLALLYIYLFFASKTHNKII